MQKEKSADSVSTDYFEIHKKALAYAFAQVPNGLNYNVNSYDGIEDAKIYADKIAKEILKKGVVPQN